MTPDQALITTGEAAKRLGVTSNTLRRWALLKSIPHVRMPSGRLRFRPSDVAAVLVVQQTGDAA